MRLADFILANVEPILAEWEVFARRSDLTGKMNPAALRDHAEDMILAIARDMGSAQSSAEQSSKSMGDRDTVAGSRGMGDASRAHGRDRATSGFKLVNVVAEYRALRASVLRLWKASVSAPAREDLEDLGRFNEAIDQSLAMATLTYTEAADRSRQMFLTILGHDLRNPLAAIRVMVAELIRDPGLADDKRSAVALIRESAADMNQLVQELIDLSRHEVGADMPLSPAAMDLGDLCRQLVAETRAAAPGRVIGFRAKGDLGGEWDRGRLRQAVSNLLGNAVQHGSGAIDVRAEGGGKDGVVLRVHNDGEPISPEALPRLFNPFARAGNSAAGRKRPGSLGLGLYIARAIVTAHGGQIDLESSQDAGTTFTVRLPRAPAGTAAEEVRVVTRKRAGAERK